MDFASIFNNTFSSMSLISWVIWSYISTNSSNRSTYLKTLGMNNMLMSHCQTLLRGTLHFLAHTTIGKSTNPLMACGYLKLHQTYLSNLGTLHKLGFSKTHMHLSPPLNEVTIQENHLIIFYPHNKFFCYTFMEAS